MSGYVGGQDIRIIDGMHYEPAAIGYVKNYVLDGISQHCQDYLNFDPDDPDNEDEEDRLDEFVNDLINTLLDNGVLIPEGLTMSGLLRVTGEQQASQEMSK